jgi:hypothetical protein
MAVPFQFSIRLLILAVTLVAVILSVLVAKPSWPIGMCLILLTLVLPAGFVAGAMFGRGWLQAFSAGALIPGFVAPYVLLFIGLVSSMGPSIAAGTPTTPMWQRFAEAVCRFDCKFIVVGFWVAMLITGAICVLFRWLLDDTERVTSKFLDSVDQRTPPAVGAPTQQ